MLDDFLLFYKDSCLDKEKKGYVWTNLYNLKYRNDLRKEGERIWLDQQLYNDRMMRYYVKGNK